MQQVLLDTNFIITCIKQKIDFFDDLKFKGYEIIIPKQVLEELKKLAGKKGTASAISEFAIKYLKTEKFKTIDLKNNQVDEAIIDYAKAHESTIIATLDYDIKYKINNPRMVIMGRKKLEIV
ncbi:hypothetical protein HY212_06125 [Candidatus Pacearchaeota archaeon]|nr:hypothetical protein [Candidatus Pacearchaeota archaeon]